MKRHALVLDHATGLTRYVLDHATGLTRCVLGVAVAGVLASCATSSDGGGGASASIGQQAVDAMDSGRDAGCTTDKRLVETALLAHYTLMGYDATTMGDLVQFGVENEPDRWTLQIPADATDTAPAVVATAGGPCDS